MSDLHPGYRSLLFNKRADLGQFLDMFIFPDPEISGRDPASCFHRGSLKACERALHSGHDLGSHAEVEIVLAEERDQHFGPGSADDRMSAGVGGVWGGVADLGKPVGISVGVRVSIRRGCANCGYRAPEIVSVFGIVKGDDPIGKTKIQ